MPIYFTDWWKEANMNPDDDDVPPWDDYDNGDHDDDDDYDGTSSAFPFLARAAALTVMVNECRAEVCSAASDLIAVNSVPEWMAQTSNYIMALMRYCQALEALIANQKIDLDKTGNPAPSSLTFVKPDGSLKMKSPPRSGTMAVGANIEWNIDDPTKPAKAINLATPPFFHCGVCNIRSDSIDRLIVHAEKNHARSCPLCVEMIQPGNNLRFHISKQGRCKRLDLLDQRVWIECDLCKDLFVSMQAFDNHRTSCPMADR